VTGAQSEQILLKTMTSIHLFDAKLKFAKNVICKKCNKVKHNKMKCAYNNYPTRKLRFI
jgi:hypothetical protein